MKRFKPWLVLALVFVAGVVFGVVATRIAVRHFVKVAIAQPDRLRDRIEQNMTRRLSLTAEQRVKVHASLVQAHDRIKSLRAEIQPRFVLILSDTSDEITATLTPEQQGKFAKFREENRELFQEIKSR